MIKSKEIGRIPGGDVVCVSKELFLEVSGHFGLDAEEFLATLGGVSFNLPGVVKNVGVDLLTAVNKDGSTGWVVLVGADPGKFLRFLEEDEQEFREYWESRKNTQELKKVADEYRRKLLSRILGSPSPGNEGVS